MSLSVNSESFHLKQTLAVLVSAVNGSNLKTLYTYTGKKTTHEPIYYEETELFKCMLKTIGISINVIEVSDDEFKPEEWDPETSVLHIPGASSTKLDEHIGKAIDKIKVFVNAGGRFLGWCGGGYWACHKVEYKDGNTKFEKTRELSLWNGSEKGPLLPYHGNPEGTVGWFHGAIKLTWGGSDLLKQYLPAGIKFYSLLSGGGVFFPDKNEHTHKTLGVYTDHKEAKASVKTLVGKGVCVLLNPYFTHGPDYLEKGLEGYKKHFPEHGWDDIMDKLQSHENQLKNQICFADVFLELTKA